MIRARKTFRSIIQTGLCLWLVALLALNAVPGDTASAASSGPWVGTKPWITILCKYKDISSEPQTRTFYHAMMNGTAPSLSNYFFKASNGQLKLTGSQVKGWYTLPKSRAGYKFPSGGMNKTALAQDCTANVPNSDFAFYHGINLIFNGKVDDDGNSTGYNDVYLELGGKTNWPVTYITANGSLHQSHIAHEMGHAMNMIHSTDSLSNDYSNIWDIMSNNYTGTPGYYGYEAQYPIAINKYYAGWLSGRVATYTTNAGGTFNPVVQQHSNAYNDSTPLLLLVKYGSNKFYTIEARTPTNYDEKLPSRGVIIHKVEGPNIGLMDEDNDGDTADQQSYLTPGETIELPIPGKTSKIKVTYLSDTGVNFNLRIVIPNAPF